MTALAKLAEPNCLEEINAERQKLRAKQRFVEQHSNQLGVDADELAEKRTQLEETLKQTQSELQELRLTIRSEEKEAALTRKRLLQDTADLQVDNGERMRCYYGEVSLGCH